MRSLTFLPTPRAGRLLGVAACAAALGLSTACGSPPAPAAPAPPSPQAQAPANSGRDASGDMSGMDMNGHGMAGMAGMGSGGLELYAVQTGGLGVVVTDGGGRLLYGSNGDANDPPASRCTATCAQEWEPLVVPDGQQPELLGVTADKVGRLVREDGSSQLTLGGWPVYTNRSDDGGSNQASPDAHGKWFVLTPQGGKVPL